MKRLLLTALLAVLTLSGNLAAKTHVNDIEKKQATNAKGYTRYFDVKDFSSINAGSIFNIQFLQGDTYKVEISSNKDILDKLLVRKDNETLILGIYGDLKEKNLSINVKITAPSLKGINLSGAGKFSSNSLCIGNTLDLDISGAAKATLFNTDCSRLKLNCSGAGKLEGEFKVEKDAVLILSGAGKADLKVQAENLTINSSGAGRTIAEIECEVVNVNASGAGSVTLSGKAKVTNFKKSGASSINIKALH